MIRRLVSTAVLSLPFFLVAAKPPCAWAQTDTPTATITATQTETVSPTPTPSGTPTPTMTALFDAVAGPVLISDGDAPNENSFAPAVAVNAGGTYAIVWQVQVIGVDQGDGPPVLASSLRAQVFNSLGQPLGPKFVAYSSLLGVRRHAVAIDAGGNLTVVWEPYQIAPATPHGLFARRFAADGAPLTGVISLDALYNTDDNGFSLAGAPNGDFGVAWRDTAVFELRIARYSASGSPLGSSSTPALNVRPHIALESGSFVVSFYYPVCVGPNCQLKGVKLDAGGNVIVSEFVLGDTLPAFPALASLPDGSQIVIRHNGSTEVGRLVDANGVPLESEFRLDDDADPVSFKAVAVAPNGSFAIVGFSLSSFSPVVKTRMFDSNGNRLGTTETATVAGGANAPVGTNVSDPRVLMLGNGGYLVVWDTQVGVSDTSFGEIFARRYADPACGDGLLQAGNGETCDDLNNTDGDGCTAACVLQVCGDGTQQAGEDCDDFNSAPLDGCDSTCKIEKSVAATLLPLGTISTDAEMDGATPSDPIESSLTSPSGGSVSVVRTTDDGAFGGVTILGQRLVISAPSETPASPIVLTLRIDASLIPVGEDENTIQVFRNGIILDACTGAPGEASPNPCVSSRVLLGDGDVEITALTTQASIWTLGVTCGDGNVNAGEDCDDANTAALDGCSAACLDEASQSDAQITCLKTMAKGNAKVAKAERARLAKCMSVTRKDSSVDADLCVATILADSTVVKAAAKSIAAEADKCSSPPDFGFVVATEANVAASTLERELMHDLFGNGLDAATIDKDIDGAGAACQSKVLKATGKITATMLAEFGKCLGAGFKADAIRSADALAACLGEDVGGKIAKAQVKSAEARTKACAAVALGSAFPGKCTGEVGGDFDDCIVKRVNCRVCLAMEALHALDLECELFDDGQVNGSCP